MEDNWHSLTSLFEQLGLPSGDEEINEFVESNGPLPSNIELDMAAFWTKQQAAFLREGIDQDADWAEIIDQLNVMLRKPK